MAVVAPIPSAKVRTATAARPRDLRSIRKPWRRFRIRLSIACDFSFLLVAQRNRWIDLGCSAGGDVSRHQSRDSEDERHGRECGNIPGANSKEKPPNKSCDCDGAH